MDRKPGRREGRARERLELRLCSFGRRFSSYNLRREYNVAKVARFSSNHLGLYERFAQLATHQPHTTSVFWLCLCTPDFVLFVLLGSAAQHLQKIHENTAKVTTVQEILPWRDLYRQEMNCQIIHDSLHARKGWTEPYLLMSGGVIAGYGSIAVGGPWKGKPAIFEFYVAPPCRSHVFDLFSALLTACKAEASEAQSNDPLLMALLHTFAQNVTSSSILFHDKLTTAHLPDGAIFRHATADDAARVFPHQVEPVGDWVLEVEGRLAATGGILFHYNRPYGDIYMEVAAAFRRRGLGCYLVQELKRVCYEQGSVPAARCSPMNIPSRKTLQKAGFVPCGHILTGSVSPSVPQQVNVIRDA